MTDFKPIRGRGTAENLPNRFQDQRFEYDPDFLDDQGQPQPQTTYIRDSTRSIIAYNNSPDVGFDASINVYRGCEHGCAYCYARPTHEYLGYSSGLDFETKILVKHQGPELLRNELNSDRYTPQVLAMSGVTDPYQPVERKLQLTRQCLKVLTEFRNPVAMITKNHLVTRDIDILTEMAQRNTVNINLSLTTLDGELKKTMEPRTSHPDRRLRAIHDLSEQGIPVGVLIAPVIPGLTDHEIPHILEKAASAGARYAGYILLRLPYQNKDLFEGWLERQFPEKKNKVLNRIRDMRDGKLNNTAFGERMRGTGNFAEQISDLFHMSCEKFGLQSEAPALTTEHFRRRRPEQMALFE
ncbi:MAG: PA0069 family radical SAM protein [Candidatus Marinimicrobia bacterium]|nr:PA0069 family radical SAM protein [Candidatus Neomarinimicrobiota bacterium]